MIAIASVPSQTNIIKIFITQQCKKDLSLGPTKGTKLLSIGDWELCKIGLDGDNSYLKFLLDFIKRKLCSF